MSLFVVTFGQRFHRDQHPLFPPAHPDGWVAVEARDEHQAHLLAFAALGRQWAFVYPASMPGRFAEASYPLGCLGWIISVRGDGARVIPRSERCGWVEKRPDDIHAKCGGPAICPACRVEQLIAEAAVLQL